MTDPKSDDPIDPICWLCDMRSLSHTPGSPECERNKQYFIEATHRLRTNRVAIKLLRQAGVID